MVYERYIINFWTHWHTVLNAGRFFAVQCLAITLFTVENRFDGDDPWWTIEYARKKRLEILGIEEDEDS
jgi:hypothetical protein